MSNTFKAMFFNGSPRKQWTLPSSESHQAGLNGRVVRKEGVANTAKMLESAMKGAEGNAAAGAEVVAAAQRTDEPEEDVKCMEQDY